MNYENLYKQAIFEPEIEGLRRIEQGKYTIFALDNGPESSVNLSKEYIEQFQNIRGVIFETNTKRLVCRSIPYTKTLSVEEFQQDIHDSDLKNKIIFESTEGTLIRVFFDDTWHISTNKKIDAYKSKWKPQGQSFGEMFELSLKNIYKIDIIDFFKLLDKTKQYIFFLSSQYETKLVCDLKNTISEITLLTIINSEHNFESVQDVKIGNINPIKTLPNIKTKKDIINHVLNIPLPFLSQGIAVLDEKTMETVKILNPLYLKLFKLRRGENSIPFSFLWSMKNLEDKKLFYKFFPELTQTFKEYEVALEKYSNIIYKLYCFKFFKTDIDDENKTLMDETCYSKAISFCSSYYISNKQHNKYFKINLQTVKHLLLENPTILNKIINFHKRLEKIKSMNQLDLSSFV